MFYMIEVFAQNISNQKYLRNKHTGKRPKEKKYINNINNNKIHISLLSPGYLTFPFTCVYMFSRTLLCSLFLTQALFFFSSCIAPFLHLFLISLCLFCFLSLFSVYLFASVSFHSCLSILSNSTLSFLCKNQIRKLYFISFSYLSFPRRTQ